ncbi:MAG: YqgE/AlgH family protein [Pseudomonadota bacterium]
MSVEAEPSAPHESLAGCLLVAMPNMTDNRFAEAVILMLSHDAEHAMGVVINKTLQKLSLADLAAQLDIEPGPHSRGVPVHYGGPVQTNRGFVIHTTDYQGETGSKLDEGLAVTTHREIVRDLAVETPTLTPPGDFVFAVGYAGWGAGQLEEEVLANVWLHLPSARDLVFSKDLESIWDQAFERLGVSRAMFSSEWSMVRDANTPVN